MTDSPPILYQLTRLIEAGGWSLVAILALSFLGWTLIVLKWHRSRVEQELRQQWQTAAAPMLASGDVDALLQICESYPCLSARIVTFVLHSGRVHRTAARHVGAFVGSEAAHGRSRLLSIAVIAGVLPLLGLLGTVSGMIRTFQAISGGGSDPQLLAAGITQALITTEAGLLTALPVVLGHAWLAGRWRRELETAAVIARHAERLRSAGRPNEQEGA